MFHRLPQVSCLNSLMNDSFCSYSVEFLQKDDEEGRIQALSALVNSFQKENDLQTALRTAMCIGNLCHENDEVYSMIETLLIKANFKKNQPLRMLELWGRKEMPRKGWVTVA